MNEMINSNDSSLLRSKDTTSDINCKRFTPDLHIARLSFNYMI